MDGERLQSWEHRHRSIDGVGTPSAFVTQALDVLATETPARNTAPRALDVACGRGRHALLLAERGYSVDAVDFALPALLTLGRAATARGLDVRGFVADLSTWPLARALYDLVVVVSFLDRALFPALREAVVPGGAVIYETHRHDETCTAAPTVRPEFRLGSGELDATFHDWRILLRHEETTLHRGGFTPRAGILARRPLTPPH